MDVVSGIASSLQAFVRGSAPGFFLGILGGLFVSLAYFFSDTDNSSLTHDFFSFRPMLLLGSFGVIILCAGLFLRRWPRICKLIVCCSRHVFRFAWEACAGIIGFLSFVGVARALASGNVKVMLGVFIFIGFAVLIFLGFTTSRDYEKQENITLQHPVITGIILVGFIIVFYYTLIYCPG